MCDTEAESRNATFHIWYTSYLSAKSLFEKKIPCTGTLKKDKREILSQFQANKNREKYNPASVFRRA
jgi:hypothetical protein